MNSRIEGDIRNETTLFAEPQDDVAPWIGDRVFFRFEQQHAVDGYVSLLVEDRQAYGVAARAMLRREVL